MAKERPIPVRLGLTIACAVVTVLVFFRLAPQPELLYRLEAAALDARFKLRGPLPAADEIVVVAIDESSLKDAGRWPWPRATQAELVNRIAKGRPKVIGLDIIYAEPTADDEVLAASIRNAKNVVLAFPLQVSHTRPQARADAAMTQDVSASIARHRVMVVRHANARTEFTPYIAEGLIPPVPVFAREAAALGHVYFIPDRDGITRYEYTAVEYGEAADLYPSFALEAARLYLGVPKAGMSVALGESVTLGERMVPIDQKARMLINYVGRERSYRYVSAGDVLNDRVAADLFRDKIALVGTAALGTYDQKATPFSANVPGVEKNATVIDNILHQRCLSRSAWAGPLDLLTVFAFGLALGLVLPRTRALTGALLTGAGIVGYVGASQYLFVVHGLWLDLFYPVATATAVFVAVNIALLVTEQEQARTIRTMFATYVSPHVVEELIRDPTKATVGGERKELTMLFCDLVHFTAFSDQYPAEKVVAQLNEYLSAMTDVVFHWNGTVDKFVGDAVVAFWGAPLAQPNHVELGVKCALHMRRRLSELQEKWKAEGRMVLDSGIGINTGVAIVGNIGAEGKRMDYTMIGDQVNLAARVQELTREYGKPIIVTESTAARLKELVDTDDRTDNRGRLGHIALRGLDAVRVRGRSQYVAIFALESLPRAEPSLVNDPASPAPSLRAQTP